MCVRECLGSRDKAKRWGGVTHLQTVIKCHGGRFREGGVQLGSRERKCRAIYRPWWDVSSTISHHSGVLPNQAPLLDTTETALQRCFNIGWVIICWMSLKLNAKHWFKETKRCCGPDETKTFSRKETRSRKFESQSEEQNTKVRHIFYKIPVCFCINGTAIFAFRTNVNYYFASLPDILDHVNFALHNW